MADLFVFICTIDTNTSSASWNTYYDQEHNNLKLLEIHLLKDEPSASTEDSCRPTLAKPPRLEFNRRQLQATSYKKLMKLGAGHVVDEMLCPSDRSLENTCHREQKTPRYWQFALCLVLAALSIGQT